MFSVVAIATTALAIGANATVFTLVSGMLLNPLPYPHADRIVQILERQPSGAPSAISTLNYLDWASQNLVFEFLAAETSWQPTLTGGAEPLFVRGARVGPHYFDIFSVQPALGRTFVDDDALPGHDRVVVLGHAFWANRFAGDERVLQRDITLDGEPYTVVGVLPPGPFDRTAAQVWRPLAFTPSERTRDVRWLTANAKLKTDVSIGQARTAMDLMSQRLATQYPDIDQGWSVAVDRLADVVVGPDARGAVLVMFLASLLVLLIGCANLASLTLARGVFRAQDMAVRSALGANRGLLARQLLFESLAVTLCGGLVGIAISAAALKGLAALIPADALPPGVDIGLHPGLFIFTLVAAVVSGMLIGLAPAVTMTSSRLATAVKEAGRSASGAPVRRLRTALVVAEIALAFVLLAASATLMRSFLNLLQVNPGFDATNVLTVGVPLTSPQKADATQLSVYVDSIRSAVDAIPSVQQTAVTSALPLRGWGIGTRYGIVDRPDDPARRRHAFFKIVSPSYFAALRMTIREGRGLRDTDGPGSTRVAVINETLNEREFPNHDAIGRHIRMPEIRAGAAGPGADIDWEIVGVVANERINDLGDDTSAGVYVSSAQNPSGLINLLIRTDRAPENISSGVRSAIQRINPLQAVSDVRLLEDIVDRARLGNRVMSVLFTVFAALALVLAVVGTYGVIAYTTAQRAHDMAIRSALGASTRDLRRLVFWSGMRPALAGMAIGLAATVATTRLMATFVFGVTARDPATLIAVSAVVGIAAGLASLLPARRITRVNSTDVLRS